MRDLERLERGLTKSHKLLYKNYENGMECSFLREGLVVDSFMIEDHVLASALSRKGSNGIVEGTNFHALKSNYDWFSISVKSRKLYEELTK